MVSEASVSVDSFDDLLVWVAGDGYLITTVGNVDLMSDELTSSMGKVIRFLDGQGETTLKEGGINKNFHTE